MYKKISYYQYKITRIINQKLLIIKIVLCKKVTNFPKWQNHKKCKIPFIIKLELANIKLEIPQVNKIQMNKILILILLIILIKTINQELYR